MLQVIKVGSIAALYVMLIVIAAWVLWTAFGSPGAPSPSPTTVTMSVPVMPEDIDRG